MRILIIDDEVMQRELLGGFLKKKGYDAFERDWDMGKTVAVGVGRTEHPEGIITNKRMAYIAPQNNKWLVTELDNHTSENDQSYSTLHEACEGVVILLNQPV